MDTRRRINEFISYDRDRFMAIVVGVDVIINSTTIKRAVNYSKKLV
jgi:hypothetical protein